MKQAVLFLHGRYRKADHPFYARLCSRRYKVAVDGGYRFFRAAGITPNLLIGDFDSLKRPRKLSPRTAIVSHPTAKDKTDTQLAVEYCIELGIEHIDLVVPSVGEPDHYLGVIALLELVRRVGPDCSVRIINPAYQIVLLENSEAEFSGCKGDMVSVVPFNRNVKLSWTGMEYNIENSKIRPGETRGLRNMVVKSRARLELFGKGLVIHRFLS